jgi:hypothetical protein
VLLSFRRSNECPQKHGGFSCLLTQIGSSGSWQLPLTNRDPTLEIKSFTLLFFQNFDQLLLFICSTENLDIFSVFALLVYNSLEGN